MAQNFVCCDREQVLLLPPSLTDWLPEDHLVWTVLGAVEQMDLARFYGTYRANGQGRASQVVCSGVTLDSGVRVSPPGERHLLAWVTRVSG
jgi:hypothetical protein